MLLGLNRHTIPPVQLVNHVRTYMTQKPFSSMGPARLKTYWQVVYLQILVRLQTCMLMLQPGQENLGQAKTIIMHSASWEERERCPFRHGSKRCSGERME